MEQVTRSNMMSHRRSTYGSEYLMNRVVIEKVIG